MSIPDKMLAGVKKTLVITSDVTLGVAHGGAFLAFDPSGGTIVVTLPDTLPDGFHCEAFKVSTGTVYFVEDGAATIYNTDTALALLYSRVRVTKGIGVGNEWVLEGSLEAAPGALPTEMTYYWSIESVAVTGSDIDTLNERVTGTDNYTQTGAARPTVAASGGPGGTVDAIVFNGSSQYFPRIVYSTPIAQSFFITVCMDELTGGGAEGTIFDETPAGSNLMMRMSYGSINAYSGGGGSYDVIGSGSLPAGWYVHTVHFNGTSTASRFASGAFGSSIPNGGGSGCNGLSLGARSGGTIFGNMRMTDFAIGVGTQADANVVHDYIRTARGL